jgi:hypothetical protein
MPPLPSELYFFILDFGESKSDLASLARVCRRLQHQCERLIYFEVCITVLDEFIRFARRIWTVPRLGNYINKFDVEISTTSAFYFTSTFANLVGDALQKMTRLRHLTIRLALPLYYSDRRFIRLVYGCRECLKEPPFNFKPSLRDLSSIQISSLSCGINQRSRNYTFIQVKSSHYQILLSATYCQTSLSWRLLNPMLWISSYPIGP